jgi:hypothetical protein
MVDRARYNFRLSQFNELAAADDLFSLSYFVRNNGETDIEIIGECACGPRLPSACACSSWGCCFTLCTHAQSLAEQKHRRKFLARMPFKDLKLDDVRPGAKVVIFSRQYVVVDYEDKATREALGKTQQTAFALSSEPSLFGRLLLSAEALGLRLSQARMVTLSPADAGSVAGELGPGRAAAGASVALEFVGADASERVRTLAAEVPGLLYAQHAGGDGALTPLFFGSTRERLASVRDSSGTFADCTCAIVLPSAVASGVAASLLAELLAQLDAARPPLRVSALRTLTLPRAAASEFLEVYKQVVPDFVVSVGGLRVHTTGG